MADSTNIFNQDKLLEMYEALPKGLKEAIFSVDVSDKIMKAGQKFGLNIEQTGKLAEITGLVMLGALHPRSYVQKLEEELKVERSKAIDIAKEINHEIFFPVREALKKLHNMEDTEEVTGERTMEKGDLLKRLADLKSAPASQPVPPIKPLTPPQPPTQRPSVPAPIPPPTPQQTQKLSAPTEPAPQPTTQPAIQARPSPTLKERFAPKERSAPPPAPAKPPQLKPEPENMNQESRSVNHEAVQPRPQNPVLQNEIRSILKKELPPQKQVADLAPKPQPPASLPVTPVPDVPVEKAIPTWAQPPDQRRANSVERIEKADTDSTQQPKSPLQQAEKSVQKIPMQEIRPRSTGALVSPAKPVTQETPIGPKGDKYREPIE